MDEVQPLIQTDQRENKWWSWQGRALFIIAILGNNRVQYPESCLQGTDKSFRII
jgi:hypothetical protein